MQFVSAPSTINYPQLTMPTMTWNHGEYTLTDDPRCTDLDTVCALLRPTYWADKRSREVIAKSIEHSLCFSLIHSGRQVGFARAVTDRATFAWICDVIIAPEHRGQGLGKWMMECIIAHPDLQDCTQLLRTKDAHTLYERFGFARSQCLRRGSMPDLCPLPSST
jgi:GNAT superfamily N-acetyltransferase